MEAVVPHLEQLVRLEGRPHSSQWVTNIVFRGLRFAHTAWRLPDEGLACAQAVLPVLAMFCAQGAHDCTIEGCEFAVYWDASGKPIRPLGLSWDEWKTKTATIGSPLDYHSVVADPKFVDPKKDDFRLKPDSPAAKIGFQPFGLEGVGPRGK